MSNPPKKWTRRVCLGVLTTLALVPAGCLNWSGDVARYRRVLDGVSPATAPATQPVYQADAPLPLARALQLADADNESIAAQGENYIQALADKMRQAGTFLPTLSLDPSYTWGGGHSGASTHQFSVPLHASATGSLANASSVEAAGLTAQQREQLLLDERETILFQVAQAYYSVLTYQNQAQVYENSVRVKTEKVRDQEERLKLGGVRPLDVAQSQADLAATRVSLTQARTNAANARSALARLMGVDAVTGPLTDDFTPPPDVPPLEQWQTQAQTTRQDVAAADRAVAAAQANLDAAIREYFPSVTVNFNYLLHSDPTSLQSWTGAVSANLPLFSALAIEADIRQKWSLYRQAGLSQSQVRRQARDDINESYQSLQGSRQNIIDLQTQVEAAQRAADLAEQAYELGSVSNLDRLTQQDNLLTAQLNLANEQFNEKTHYLSLLRAAGQLATVLGPTR